LAVYGLFCLASALWSAYPAWTFYKSLEYLVDISLLAAILATVRCADTYRSLFNWTWVLLGVQLLIVWTEAVIWPSLAFLQSNGLIPLRLNGVLPSLDQNEVGEYGAVLGIVALSRLLQPRRSRGRVFYCLLFGFALVTMVMSQTRAVYIGFLFGCVLVLILCKRFALIAFLAFTIMMTVALTNAPNLAKKVWQRDEDAQNVQMIGGRLSPWESGLAKFLEKPLTGYGAYVGGRFVVLQMPGQLPGSSILNFYLETILGTGVCGLGLFVVAMLGTWWILVFELRKGSAGGLDCQLTIEAVGVLALTTVRSFFGTQLMWHPALNFLLILGYAEFLRRHRTYKTSTMPVSAPFNVPPLRNLETNAPGTITGPRNRF
jgi:O-antigen ligase